MALTLTYHTPQDVPVEVEGITPSSLAGKTRAEIDRLPVFVGNRSTPLAELFSVGGDLHDGELHWEGALAGVHWLGAKMDTGHMYIHGPAGRHVGSQMTGGQIEVEGDAGDWVGGELRGGLIRVGGNAGHLVGAAYRGSRRGMTGGTILITGNAGNEAAHTMRRGLVAIGGQAGDLGGFSMLAGTLLVFGEAGIRFGAGMKRGTIGFFGPRPELLSSFRHAGRYEPLALRLVLRHLQRHSFPLDEKLITCTFDLFHGDFIEGGRGEVLMVCD